MSRKKAQKAQKPMKTLETTPNQKRRELSGPQDPIDRQRDEGIEKQLKQTTTVQALFGMWWKVEWRGYLCG